MEEAKARFQQVEALFNRALTVSLVERDALIDTQCGGDGELAEEVRSLLSASEAEERSASDAMRRASGETVAPPRIVGHYQLDRLIGRGGMGRSTWRIAPMGSSIRRSPSSSSICPWRPICSESDFARSGNSSPDCSIPTLPGCWMAA